MGLKVGMWTSLLLAGRSGSRDLKLGCTIWNIYGNEGIVESMMRVLRSRPRVISLLPCFRGEVWGWSTVGTGAAQF